MHHYLVNTKKLPCAVNFKITAGGSSVPVYILGYDPFNANTMYFRSRFSLTGAEDITLNCPQSPSFLKILVWSEDDLPYQLDSVSLLPLAVPKSSNPIVLWIETFSSIVGRLRPGNYVGDNVPFKVELKRNIYDDNGNIHPTPARIHEELPLIQVSKSKFDQMTIPERIIILLHEVAHNYINMDQDSEIESDQNALDIYNELGYPQIEAVNAFGNIMADTDDNYARMLNLVSM